MIRLDCDVLRVMPGFREWEAKADDALEALLLAKSKGKEHELDAGIWQTLKRDFLREFAHGKCMYCEGNYQAGSYDDGEHYRPKKRVRGSTHDGYYWLAYAWQNILLACNKCNRPPGKGTQFPIDSPVRVDCPCDDRSDWWAELAAEQPLLLHPYFDDPAEHLEIRRYGKLRGTTARGRTTVKVCDLNRQALCEERVREEVHIPALLTRRLHAYSSSRAEPDEPVVPSEERFSFYLNAALLRAVSGGLV